jgi:hypothetical protein
VSFITSGSVIATRNDKADGAYFLNFLFLFLIECPDIDFFTKMNAKLNSRTHSKQKFFVLF